MNIPRFTADVSIYQTNNTYRFSSDKNILITRTTIELALPKQGGFTCSGECPKDRPIMCSGDKNCICCETGCAQDKDGNAFCTHDRGIYPGGGSSIYSQPGGGILY